MKVKKITVMNLKALSALSVDLNGCTAIITGGNNKGKSSFLKSLPERLQGIKPNVVLKKGEEDGQAIRELTDGSKFIWKFDKKKEKLMFIDKEGVELKKGIIKMLGEKYFGNKFDIDVFLTATPKKQREMLQELVGLDLSEIDKKYKEAYEKRTELNAIKKSEEAKTEGLSLKKIEGEYKDISEMQNKLLEVERNNNKYKEVELGVKTRMDKIEELKKEIEKLEISIGKGNKRLKENKIEESTNGIQEEIKKQTEINNQIEENKKVQELFTASGKAKTNRDKADKDVKTIDKERINLVKKAKLPEGFEFTDDGILFNGFELDKKQLSSSQIYIAALKLAAMNIGEIKTLCFDASYLDNTSLGEIQTRADKQGLQLLIERPDYEGGEIKYEITQSE